VNIVPIKPHGCEREVKKCPLAFWVGVLYAAAFAAACLFILRFREIEAERMITGFGPTNSWPVWAGFVPMSLLSGALLAWICLQRRSVDLPGSAAASQGRPRLLAEVLYAEAQEKRKLAAELQDGLGRLLYSAVPTAAAASKETANDVLQPLSEAIEELRRVQSHLRPSLPQPESISLEASVRRLCVEYRCRFGLDVRLTAFRLPAENALPELVELALYRMVQETLQHIARHSSADRVEVSVREGDGAVELTIVDNGIGYGMEEKLFRRGELGALEANVVEFGGRVAVHGSAGCGTSVSVRIPLTNGR